VRFLVPNPGRGVGQRSFKKNALNALKQAAEKREFLEGDGLQAVHNGFCSECRFTGCGKTLSPEGDGLQPVRNYFEMNVALATEGTTLSKQRPFPHPL
jgi:hypothetical protein